LNASLLMRSGAGDEETDADTETSESEELVSVDV
jgi:hypothetical protein